MLLTGDDYIPHLKQYLSGNGLLTTKDYTPTGFLKEIETGNVQQLKYDFNETTGNLNWREDLSGNLNLHEDFTYDELLKNRLETWQVENRQMYSISYTGNGNFNSKTDVGSDFVYGQGMMNDNAGPHAVKRVMAPAADYLDMARSIQNITYTGFNKTSHISVRNENKSNKPEWELDIEYGPDNFRRTTRLVMNNELVKFKTFVGGSYEIETDAQGLQRKLHYISGGSGLCAIYVTGDEHEDGNMYYILKDHLGSIYAVTNENGEIAIHNGRQQIYSFDPWGRRRNHNDWTFQDVPTAYLFDRGFTKHEHLDELGLINMNGRMYEPWLGRFLSPDNYVQMPDYSQNLNRYSYALNNPLVFTDPTGEKWWHWLLADILTGGAVSLTAATAATMAGTTAITSGTAGFIKGFFSTGSGRFSSAGIRAQQDFINSLKISGGLYVSDPNKGFFGRAWEITSRFTWQAPQTVIGIGYAHSANVIFSTVKSVDYYGGATVINVKDLPLDFDQAWAVTLGSYILGEGISADPFETVPDSNQLSFGAKLLRHEYGHYIQSQRAGFAYLPKYGISSAAGADWTEVDAEFRSDQYFSRYYGSSPIFSGNYPVGYKPVNPKWWEYGIILGGGYFIGGGIVGALNLNRGR